MDRAGLNNLVNLHHLEKLTLSYDHEFPNNIAFPDKLNKITLQNMTISLENLSGMGSLHNLQVLKLVKCKFAIREWEPVEGEFQQLKYLEFGVSNLEDWKVESTHFPFLEQLILDSCYYLKELPAELGEIESLQKLVVNKCNRPVGDSARAIQEEQQMYGNFQLQVLVEHLFDD